MAGKPLDLTQALNAFMEEARELLAQMEEILLRAEDGHCSDEDLKALFRCAHTIKGSGGLFGLDEVVRFTHVVENVLDRLRKGTLQFNAPLITLLLESQDHVSNLIAVVGAGQTPPSARSDELIARLQGVLGERAVVAVPVPPHIHQDRTDAPEGEAVMAPDHWHLSLRFGEKVLQDGMDPLAFINYLSPVVSG